MSVLSHNKRPCVDEHMYLSIGYYPIMAPSSIASDLVSIGIKHRTPLHSGLSHSDRSGYCERRVLRPEKRT